MRSTLRVLLLTSLMMATGQLMGTSAANVNETCTADGDCTTPATILVCDKTLADHKCKIKSGADCASHINDCVDGATCTGSTTKQCTCPSWRPEDQATKTCAAPPSAGTAGGPCAASSTACTGPDLVCEDRICKTKHGSACSTHPDLCVNGAVCPTSGTQNCVCDSATMAPTLEGLCAAKVPVAGNCTGGKTCEDNLVCEGNICKYKNGTDCTAHDKECVDGANCTGTGTPKVCACGTGRTPATSEGKCAAAITPGAKVAVGGACTAASSCDTGLVCDNDKCKYKNGTDCTANDQQCVDGATCTGTPKVCVCGTDRTPATTEGKCAAKNGAPSLLASLLFVVVLVVTSRLL